MAITYLYHASAQGSKLNTFTICTAINAHSKTGKCKSNKLSSCYILVLANNHCLIHDF